jgi:GT2 family glycosyltransferase
VTAVVVTRDRADGAMRAIDSIAGAEVGFDAVVLDNNSAPAAAAALEAGCGEREAVTLLRRDRNLGCAGGRRVALDAADAELVLFLDDDAELAPGALDLLVAELDEHPEAAGVAATVTLPDGTVEHSGGWQRVTDGMLESILLGAGRHIDELPPSGASGWIPGMAGLFRRELLEEFPVDDRMRAYYEDHEWCYRVESAQPGGFRRSREARMVHHVTSRLGPARTFTTRSYAVELLRAHAHFYDRHGLLLRNGLFDMVPGLDDPAAARVLMELLLSKGTAWVFTAWMNGGLDPLLGTERLRQRDVTLALIENGGWWRLREHALPALQVFWRLRDSRRAR